MDGKPLYEWLVTQAKSRGMAGATALRGMMGFGAHTKIIHTFKIERLSEDLPIVIEIVDSKDKVEDFLTFAESKIKRGYVGNCRESPSARLSKWRDQQVNCFGIIAGAGELDTKDTKHELCDLGVLRSEKGFMLDKLSGIEQRYDDLGKELLEVGANYQRAGEINKERVDLEPLVAKSREYRQAMKSLEEAKAILASETDAELKSLAETELTDLTPKIEKLEKEIKGLLVPKDPRDEKKRDRRSPRRSGRR